MSSTTRTGKVITWPVLWLCLVLQCAAAQQPFQPTTGLWWNPARSGHGIDLHLAGDTLFLVWYSYDEDGEPLWYAAAAALDGPLWQADLLRFSWDAGLAQIDTQTVVGSVTLDFFDETRAALTWDIHGSSGTEPIERFAFGAGLPERDLTGQYYDAMESGWGLSLGSQGGFHAAVLYYYDMAGQPTWALGVTVDSGQPTLAFELSRFAPGFTPDEIAFTPRSTPAGALEFTPSASAKTSNCGLAEVLVDITLSDAPWQKSPCVAQLNAPQPQIGVAFEAPAFLNAGDSLTLSPQLSAPAMVGAVDTAWHAFGVPTTALSSSSTLPNGQFIVQSGDPGVITVSLEAQGQDTTRAYAQQNISVQGIGAEDALTAGMLVGSGEPVPRSRPTRILATAFGGTPPYRYFWSVGAGFEHEADTLSVTPRGEEEEIQVTLRVQDAADVSASQTRFLQAELTPVEIRIFGPILVPVGQGAEFTLNESPVGFDLEWRHDADTEKTFLGRKTRHLSWDEPRPDSIGFVEVTARDGAGQIRGRARKTVTLVEELDGEGPFIVPLSEPEPLSVGQSETVFFNIGGGVPPYDVGCVYSPGNVHAETGGDVEVPITLDRRPEDGVGWLAPCAVYDAAHRKATVRIFLVWAEREVARPLVDLSLPERVQAGEVFSANVTLSQGEPDYKILLLAYDGSGREVTRTQREGLAANEHDFDLSFDTPGRHVVRALGLDARELGDSAIAHVMVEDSDLQVAVLGPRSAQPRDTVEFTYLVQGGTPPYQATLCFGENKQLDTECQGGLVRTFQEGQNTESFVFNVGVDIFEITAEIEDAEGLRATSNVHRIRVATPGAYFIEEYSTADGAIVRFADQGYDPANAYLSIGSTPPVPVFDWPADFDATSLEVRFGSGAGSYRITPPVGGTLTPPVSHDPGQLTLEVGRLITATISKLEAGIPQRRVTLFYFNPPPLED